MKFLIPTYLLIALALPAQQKVEKAVVPLTDPARPARVRAQLITGGITVRGYAGREVLVETHPRESGDSHASTGPGGMHRIEMPGNAGLDIVEENNVVNIRTEMPNRAVDLVISVPFHTSLELKCLNDGDIFVEGVDGEIDADDLNGKVTLQKISGSAVAHSLNGAVTATFDRVDGSKPMSFSTLNGDIDVTFPAGTRANLRMKTDHGEIYSDFDIKVEASGSVSPETTHQKNGVFHLRFDRTLHGTLNGGGPDFQFTSFNGQIYIRKLK